MRHAVVLLAALVAAAALPGPTEAAQVCLVKITSPTPGQVVHGVLDVRGTTSGPKHPEVHVHVDGGPALPAGLWGGGTPTNWGLYLDTLAYADGPHSFLAHATWTDTIPCTASVTATFSNPSVAIAGPAANSSVAGLVAVTGSATGGYHAVSNVEVRVDGARWTEATLSGSGISVGWDAAFDSVPMPNGAHFLDARVTNAAGVSKSVRIDFAVGNPPTVDLVARGVYGHGRADRPTQSVVTAYLQNSGNSETGPFVVAVEYAYKSAWHPVATFTHPGLPGYSYGQLETTWTSSGNLVGDFPLRMAVDPAGVVAETLEMNNVRGGSGFFVTPEVEGRNLSDP